MKPFHKKFKHLISLFCVLGIAIGLYNLGTPGPACFGIVALWQLSQFAMSKKSLACYITPAGLTPEQIQEFSTILDGVKGYDEMFKALADLAKVEGGFAAIKALPALLKTEQTRNDDLQKELKKLRKLAANFEGPTGVRWIGNKPFVTDACARALTGTVLIEVALMEGGRALERLIPERSRRERMLNLSAEYLGTDLKTAMEIQSKAALDSTTTPLPTIYVPQVIELVWKYGQARQFATVYPLGAGTVKLPRLKAGEDDFGYLGVGTAGMSQNIPERRVTAELVTFTANKAGGLIRIPTEIEEDTFIPLGQFLARYISRQLAKLEDKTMFIGDGTATYANQTGVG